MCAGLVSQSLDLSGWLMILHKFVFAVCSHLFLSTTLLCHQPSFSSKDILTKSIDIGTTFCAKSAIEDSIKYSIDIQGYFPHSSIPPLDRFF